MISKTLGELWVEFKAKGREDLAKGISDIVDNLDEAKAAAKDFAAKEEEAAKKVEAANKAMQAAHQRTAAGMNVIAGAYALATAGLLGWIRAGLAGTTVGTALSLRMQFLSREIAQLFLPAIIKVVQFIERVVYWFKSLSGEQQNSIGKWIMMGVAVLGILTILPRLVSMLQLVGTALMAVFTGNPVGLIMALVAPFITLLAATKGGREAFSKLFDALQPLIAAGGNIFGTLAGVMTQIFDVAGKALVPIADAIAKLLASAPNLSAAFKPLVDFLLVMADAWEGQIKQATEMLASKLPPIVERLAALMQRLEVHLVRMGPLIDRLNDMFTEQSLLAVEGLISSLEEALSVLEAMVDAVETFGHGLVSYLSMIPGFSALMSLFEGEGRKPKRRGAGASVARNELLPNQTGFESVSETFRRLQQSSVRQELTLLQQIATNTAATASNTGGGKTARPRPPEGSSIEQGVQAAIQTFVPPSMQGAAQAVFNTIAAGVQNLGQQFTQFASGVISIVP